MSIVIRILIVMSVLFLWFFTQKLLSKRITSTDSEIKDAVHRWTQNLNAYLQKRKAAADFLLISSSLIIDALGVFLILWSVLGPSMKPILSLFILFSLRQLNQWITALPTPPGMIWRNPGFPSFFVTYDVSSDLFFSGHSALATFGALELMNMGNPYLSALGFFIFIYEISVVLILRAHWTLDVFTGVVTAFCIHQFVSNFNIFSY